MMDANRKMKLTATGEVGSPSGRRGGIIVPGPSTSSSSVGPKTQEERRRSEVPPAGPTISPGAGKRSEEAVHHHFLAKERSVLLRKNQRAFRKALDEYILLWNLRRGAFDEALRGFIATVASLYVPPPHKKPFAEQVVRLRSEWDDLFDQMTDKQEAVLDRQDSSDRDALAFPVTKRAQGTQTEPGEDESLGRGKGSEADTIPPPLARGVLVCSGTQTDPGGRREMADAGTSPDVLVRVEAHTQTDSSEEAGCVMEYTLESQPQGAPSAPLKRRRSPGLGTGGEASEDTVQGASPLPMGPKSERKKARKVVERGKETGLGGRTHASYAEVTKSSPSKRISEGKVKEKERNSKRVPRSAGGTVGGGGTGRESLGRGARLFAPVPPKTIVAGVSRTVTLPPRCFRCRRFGHIRAACRESKIDYWGRCHRCGEEGHSARWCRSGPHCLLCAHRGRGSDHWAGGISFPGGKPDVSLGRGTPGEMRSSVRPRKKRGCPAAAEVKGGSQLTPPPPREDTDPCTHKGDETGGGLGAKSGGEDSLLFFKREVAKVRAAMTSLTRLG